MKNITYASSEWSGEAARLRSLAKALADCTRKIERSDVDEGSGQIVYTSSWGLDTYCIREQQKTRQA